MLANPNNPTGNLDPPALIARLARPGRTLVVDESFIDFVPGERASLASRRELPGLVVLRSLTKIWGLAGLRAGYLLAPVSLSSASPPTASRGASARRRSPPSRRAFSTTSARRGRRRRRRRPRGPPPPTRRDTRREDVARTGELHADRGARRRKVIARLAARESRRARATPSPASAQTTSASPCAHPQSTPCSWTPSLARSIALVPRRRLREPDPPLALMSDAQRFPRPPTPPGFDPSRASQRAADPAGWRYPDEQRAAVHRVIEERRDVRRFRADDVPDEVLRRVLERRTAPHRSG